MSRPAAGLHEKLCRANLQDLSQAGFSATRGGGFPVEFNIRGRDWDTLARSTRQIMDEMRQVERPAQILPVPS